MNEDQKRKEAKKLRSEWDASASPVLTGRNPVHDHYINNNDYLNLSSDCSSDSSCFDSSSSSCD